MGFLDRLLRRTDAAGGSPGTRAGGTPPPAGGAGAGPGGAGPASGAGAAAPAAPGPGPAVAAWPVLPPMQRAVNPEHRIADWRFDGRIATFQNPSSARPGRLSILDGQPPAGMAAPSMDEPRPASSALHRPAYGGPPAMPRPEPVPVRAAPEEPVPGDGAGAGAPAPAGAGGATARRKQPGTSVRPVTAAKPPARSLTRTTGQPAGVQRRVLPATRRKPAPARDTTGGPGAAAPGPSLPPAPGAVRLRRARAPRVLRAPRVPPGPLPVPLVRRSVRLRLLRRPRLLRRLPRLPRLRGPVGRRPCPAAGRPVTRQPVRRDRQPPRP